MMEMRVLSRKTWQGSGTIEEINAGSLQRIADAVETISKPYLELLNQVERLKEYNARLVRELSQAQRSNAALRGQITKLKNQLEKVK